MKTMIQSLRLLLLMTLITGGIYPLLITGISVLIFQDKSHGSLIKDADGNIKGSRLLAQKFTRPEYFQGRPSAGDYATIASGASNKGPTSAELKKAVEDRIYYWTPTAKLNNPDQNPPEIPDELLLASGSGLDPHLSPETVYFQLNSVASARKLNEFQKENLKKLIEDLTERPQFNIFGQERINILKLNMELDSFGK